MAPATNGTRRRRVPVGALSGLAVIAVVVGVSTVSGGLFNSPAPEVPMVGQASSGPTGDGGHRHSVDRDRGRAHAVQRGCR